MDLPCMNISSRLLLGASQCIKGRLRKYRKAIIDLCFWLLPSCFGEFNRSWVGGRTVPSRSVSLIWQSVTTKWSDIDYRLSTKSHWKGFGSRHWRKSSPAMQSDCRDFLNSESGSLLHASQICAATPTEACMDTSGGTFKIQCRPWTYEWYWKCNLYVLYNHCKWQGDFSYLQYPNNSQVCWCNLGQFVPAWKD